MRFHTFITATLTSVIMLGAGLTVAAQDAKPAPLVIYDDGLSAGWQQQGWSWAKVTEQVTAGEAKPIRVEGDPWSALAFHHVPLSTAGYTHLTFFINGGVDGGQTLAIKAMIDGKAVESNYIIVLKAKQWLLVEVPLKDIGAQDKTIDGIWLQGQAEAYKPYYVTKIQLE